MTAITKLEAAKKSVVYCNEALKSDLENWERKEFETVLNDSKSEVDHLTNHINAHFDVFGVTV